MRLARKGNAMARRLALISAPFLLWLPTLAFAVGLGNIETRSALNQPLEARIPVLSASGDDLDALRIQLASAEAFERLGLDRPFLLSRLSFDIEVHDGQPYVVVRTQDPVREPFVAFLVEARWSGGRLMREYTLLLDPPVHAPGEQAPPPTVADAPAAQRRADDGRAAAAPARVPSREVATAGEAPAAAGAREYGPVRRNQTAWDVAMATRPDDSVTVHQMMMALLRANPEAFSRGNVNNLQAGAILRVPDRAEIQSMSAAESRREFARQMEEWEAGRTPAPATEEAPSEEAVAAAQAEDVQDGRLQVVGAAEAGGEDATASLLDGELDASAETVARLQQELAVSREEAADLRSENDELRQMAAEMRQRVEALERMLDLELQAGVTGVAEEGDLAAQPMPETAGEETGAAGADTLADGAEGAADQVAAEEEPRASAEAPADDAEREVAAAPAPAPARPIADDPFQPNPPAPWEDPRLMGLGAAVLLVLLALLMLIRRRRRQAAADQAELEADDALAADRAQMASAAGAAAVATGTAMAADEPEQDPLAKAESYIGYGRYDEAREVLEGALASQPEDKELRLKLLEVHALNEDRPAFEADAQTLYGHVDGGADPVWQRVVEMGVQIAPENPLFADDAAGSDSLLDETFDLDAGDESRSAADSRKPEAHSAQVDDLADVEFAGLDDEPASGEFHSPAPAEDDLSDLESALAESPEGDDDLSDLEFALGDESAGDTRKQAQEHTNPGEERDDLALDFNLDTSLHSDDSEKAEAEVAGGGETTAEADDDGFGLDFKLDRDSLKHEQATDSADALDGLDFKSGQADEAAGSLSGDEDDLFDDADENSTKLDLARAYLDMGDGEGARSLLEEVLEEGNDSQKREAEELLEKA
jgi:pilus assembly protein FimV